MQSRFRPRPAQDVDLSVQEDSPSAQLATGQGAGVGRSNAEVAEELGLNQPAADAAPTLNEEALTAVADAVIAVVPEDMVEFARTNVPAILRQCALSNMTNASQVAYVLATAQHESRFGAPLYESSESLVEDHNNFRQNRDGRWSSTVHTNGRRVRGNSEEELETRYWDSAYGGRLGNERGTTDARDFRGRGFVQLTGRDNYANAGNRLTEQGFTYTLDGTTYGGEGNAAIDLTANPDHVNRVPELAARVMVNGMSEGTFTGVGLGDYINDEETDFRHARAVVNGDTATNGRSIAEIARTYLGALGSWATVFAAVEPTNT